MNIFILDTDPRTAAEYLCDKHIPKMAVETMQMLASALRRHGIDEQALPLSEKGEPLKGGYPNHPCTVWAGDSCFNFYWLGLHGLNICNEYRFRYGKTHKCQTKIARMVDYYDLLPRTKSLTPWVQAMPDQYRDRTSAVTAYRDYYWGEKRKFAKWNRGTPAPEWWNEAEVDEVCSYLS